MRLYGGIETGGTTCACVIGGDPGPGGAPGAGGGQSAGGADPTKSAILAETRFPTTTPAETIGRMVDFFRSRAPAGALVTIGVGSFGPIDLDRRSPTYGFITTTPKPGWAHTDLCGALERALRVPVVFETDVNAAAFGEYRWASAQLTTDAAAAGTAGGAGPPEPPPDPLLYVTVGTGIGLGAIVNGRPLHGLIHPEAGHMLLPHDRELDPFPGACPYHGDCWEGLASGFALEQRWGLPGEALAPDHPGWDLQARYLGLGVANLIYCFSPHRVVIGGGVMRQAGLLARVRRQAEAAIAGYLVPDALGGGIGGLLVEPGLGARSGVLGALALAAAAHS